MFSYGTILLDLHFKKLDGASVSAPNSRAVHDITNDKNKTPPITTTTSTPNQIQPIMLALMLYSYENTKHQMDRQTKRENSDSYDNSINLGFHAKTGQRYNQSAGTKEEASITPTYSARREKE